MFFLQAGQAPVTIQSSNGTQYQIPKFTVDDFMKWGSTIMTKRVEESIKGLSDGMRREFLAFYPPVPPDMQDMRKMARSPEGVKYIVNTCLTKARVDGNPLPSDVILAVLNNGLGTLELLAWQLADLDPVAPAKPTPVDKDVNQDPLTSSESQG